MTGAEDRSGWTERWGVVGGAPFRLGGVDLWTARWESTGERFEMADPVYRETRRFDVYRVEGSRGDVRFAATELLANVWAILHPPAD